MVMDTNKVMVATDMGTVMEMVMVETDMETVMEETVMEEIDMEIVMVVMGAMILTSMKTITMEGKLNKQ